ncbi:hypothetical protein JCM10213_007134 [Rhodosporidiobolus nylandii]
MEAQIDMEMRDIKQELQRLRDDMQGLRDDTQAMSRRQADDIEAMWRRQAHSMRMALAKQEVKFRVELEVLRKEAEALRLLDTEQKWAVGPVADSSCPCFVPDRRLIALDEVIADLRAEQSSDPEAEAQTAALLAEAEKQLQAHHLVAAQQPDELPPSPPSPAPPSPQSAASSPALPTPCALPLTEPDAPAEASSANLSPSSNILPHFTGSSLREHLLTAPIPSSPGAPALTEVPPTLPLTVSMTDSTDTPAPAPEKPRNKAQEKKKRQKKAKKVKAEEARQAREKSGRDWALLSRLWDLDQLRDADASAAPDSWEDGLSSEED